MNKIIKKEELEVIVDELKRKGKRVVFTSGCFDIIHAGHVMYLSEAREKGDVLVVLLNSDLSVKNLKGSKRPIVPENERAYVLAGLESVSFVCLFDDDTPCSIIRRIKPDVVVKGGDYKGKYIPEMDTVSEYGGVVDYVHLKEGWSTTNIIEKIRSL